MKLRQIARMEQKDRLLQAIRDAGYPTPTDAWRDNRRQLGISQALIINNTNGNNAISKKAAAAYASVFGHTPGWYLFGEQEEEAPATDEVTQVPVVSLVSAGRLKRREGVSATDVERFMPVASLPSGDWIALIVDGDSMDRVAPDQSAILVNRADSQLIDGRFYVFNLDNGETTFKTFRREPMRLQPFSTNPDHMSIPVSSDEDFYVVGRVKRIIQDV